MKAPRPDTLFRIGGLVGCAVVALPMVAQFLTGDISSYVGNLAREKVWAARPLLAAVPVVTAVLFASAFWWTTKPDVFDRRRSLGLALLVGQAAIALLVSDYFFIVAAQAPFVFAPPTALIWLAGQVVVGAAVVIAVARTGAPVAIPEMAGAPPGISLVVTLAYLAGWQLFAFAVGYLAAAERRSRRELERRTRELVATQTLLADSRRQKVCWRSSRRGAPTPRWSRTP